MTSIVDRTLSKWANAKWPKYEDKITEVIADIGTRTGGYCETCEYTYGVVEFRLYSKQGKQARKRLGEEYIEGDLASFLNEILEGGPK